MRTPIKVITLTPILLSLAGVIAHTRAHAVTGQGTMSAMIAGVLSLTPVNVLDFGQLTESGLGTAVIDTAGGRTVTGGVAAAGGTPNQGTMDVAGLTGQPITFSMAAATYTVDDAGAGTPMNVDTFRLLINGGGPAATVTNTIAASPSVLNIGATLNVGAGQLPGTYTGTFTVNANY